MLLVFKRKESPPGDNSSITRGRLFPRISSDALLWWSLALLVTEVHGSVRFIAPFKVTFRSKDDCATLEDAVVIASSVASHEVPQGPAD